MAREPQSRQTRVRQGLRRGKALRGDEKERTRRIELRSGRYEIARVEVRDEADRAVARDAPMGERLADEARPKVGATDADIDHGVEGGAAEPFERTTAVRRNESSKARFLADKTVALRGWGLRASPVRHVQCGAPFGEVHRLPRKECRDRLGKRGGVCEVQ